MTRLIYLDTWIRNEDRYFTKTGEAVDPNRGNLLLRENGRKDRPYDLIAIDHSEAFKNMALRLDPVEHFGEQAVNDPKVFGQFPEFDLFLDRDTAEQISEQLANIDEEGIQSIFEKVPVSWNLDTVTKQDFMSFIVSRTHFVAATLSAKLFSKRPSLFDR